MARKVKPGPKPKHPPYTPPEGWDAWLRNNRATVQQVRQGTKEHERLRAETARRREWKWRNRK